MTNKWGLLIGGGIFIALITVCGVLYAQNKNKAATILAQHSQISLLTSAIKQKDLLISQNDIGKTLADLLRTERKNADDVRNNIRNDMQSTVKELILHDEQIRNFFTALWPDSVLRVLQETRSRLFPGDIQNSTTKGAIKPNSLPRTGRKK